MRAQEMAQNQQQHEQTLMMTAQDNEANRQAQRETHAIDTGVKREQQQNEAGLKREEIRAKQSEGDKEKNKKSESDGALARGLEAVAVALKTANAPKKIVRDNQGRAAAVVSDLN